MLLNPGGSWSVPKSSGVISSSIDRESKGVYPRGDGVNSSNELVCFKSHVWSRFCGDFDGDCLSMTSNPKMLSFGSLSEGCMVMFGSLGTAGSGWGSGLGSGGGWGSPCAWLVLKSMSGAVLISLNFPMRGSSRRGFISNGVFARTSCTFLAICSCK